MLTLYQKIKTVNRQPDLNTKAELDFQKSFTTLIPYEGNEWLKS